MSFYDDEDYSRLNLLANLSSRTAKVKEIKIPTPLPTKAIRLARMARRYREKMIGAMDKRIKHARDRMIVLEETVKSLETEKTNRLKFMVWVLDTYGDLPLPRELSVEEAAGKFPRMDAEDVETTLCILGFRKISGVRGGIIAVSFRKDL